MASCLTGLTLNPLHKEGYTDSLTAPLIKFIQKEKGKKAQHLANVNKALLDTVFLCICNVIRISTEQSNSFLLIFKTTN